MAFSVKTKDRKPEYAPQQYIRDVPANHVFVKRESETLWLGQMTSDGEHYFYFNDPTFLKKKSEWGHLPVQRIIKPKDIDIEVLIPAE